MSKCLHENFKAVVSVTRLSDVEGGEITNYAADIKIKCDQCGKPFEFVGVSAGLSKKHPTTNIDSTELRAPIRPSEGKIAVSSHYEINESEKNIDNVN